MVVEKFAGKKPKQPPQLPKTKDNANFDIPTLANDPNFPGEEVTVFKDELKPAEVREIGFTEVYRQRKADLQTEKNFRREDSIEKNSNLPLNLTPDSALNAIVMSEILGKPKALRHK